MYNFALFHYSHFVGTLYCVLPPTHEKTVTIRSDSCESDNCSDSSSQPFHSVQGAQVNISHRPYFNCLKWHTFQSDHIQQQTHTIQIAPNNGINSTPSMGASLLPVIVHPTQLVPVLPAASQSVVKRVVHAAPVSNVPQVCPPVIIKTEQKSDGG